MNECIIIAINFLVCFNTTRVVFSLISDQLTITVDTMTATSISLSWTSAGSVVDSYEVMWETDDIGGCSGGSDMDSTTITDGYEIMGLEEDSSYTITVTASNSAVDTVTAMTLEAGER